MFTAKDPYLLLSIVNTKLRDEADSLEELCLAYDHNEVELAIKLGEVGYEYDKAVNQFVSK